MPIFIEKIQRHAGFRLIGGAVIGSVLLFLLIVPIVTGFQHLYERFSSPESWYIYHQIQPAQQAFAVGETIRFNSFIEYKKTIIMSWEDTLFCHIKDNGVKKYQTQFWSGNDGLGEKKPPSLVNMERIDGVLRPVTEPNALEFWEYTADSVDPDATDCHTEHVIIGTTPLGYKKVYWISSDSFLVNQEHAVHR